MKSARRPFPHPVTPEWCSKGDGALEWYKQVYQDLAERMNGQRGDLVAMTPRDGNFGKTGGHRCLLPLVCAEAAELWDELDTTLYWRRRSFKMPEATATQARHVHTEFTVPRPPPEATAACHRRVYSDKLWVWVNGRLNRSPGPSEHKGTLDIECDKFHSPGAVNSVALLIETLPPDRNARGGLHRRVFLWSPVKSQ